MKNCIRLVLYFSGLFVIAVGINLAIISDLGVSPVSAFTVPLSQITGIRLGLVTDVVYIGFVLIEICLLGKRFRIKNLLQVPFSSVFGFFIDYTGMVLSGFIHPETYFAKLALTFAGVLVCAVGAAVYILMDVVLNPPEGLLLAICERFRLPFGRVKIVSDCTFVAIGIVISLVFAGQVTAIREGTVIAALLTGSAISIVTRAAGPALKRLAFASENTQKDSIPA